MNNNYASDRDLILALKEAEEMAYACLVENYHHQLCVYAYGLINSHDLAEDIVQNVFIRTWEKRDRLRPEFPIKNYLYRSVYNEFIDQYRKQQSVTTLEKKYIEALDQITQEDEAAFEELLQLVKREMQHLPPKCRRIFLLSKQDGLTNIEISELLNISIKTVEAHITKAFRLIRERTKTKVNLETIFFLLFAPRYAGRVQGVV